MGAGKVKEPKLTGARSGRRVARPKLSSVLYIYLLLCPEDKNPFARAEEALVSKLE
jgi:hypothetical protein